MKTERRNVMPQAPIRRTMLGKMRIKNGGYSVVEMMVVVAIMAIALSLVGLSINTIFALHTKECAKEIASELAKEKVSAMTRTGKVYLRLYQTNKGVFIDTYENGALVWEKIQVGKGSVNVTWFTETNTSGTTLDEDGIILAFNRSDGSFMTIGQARALYDVSIPMYANEYYKKIVVSGTKSIREIILWPMTGKIDLQA